jgi:putative methionine-R-sulfoxide reductase with GAF domain
VIQRYQPPRTVLASVKEKLAPGGASKNAAAPNHSVLDQVVEVLVRGRGYSWVGIYLAAGDAEMPPGSKVTTEAESGSHPASQSSAELSVPIKIASRILGVIEVEASPAKNFSRQEQALLSQVAEALARYLTTNRGKLVSRKARAATSSTMRRVPTPKSPQTESTANRVAAGQRRS